MNSSEIFRRVIEYPFGSYPDAGCTIEVIPGVHWLTTPLPFRLRSINLYLLEESDGWTIVDCGYSRDDVRTQWEQVWSDTLKGKPITRLIVTHFHPDHAGNAAWISERWNLRPWMTRGEWLTANLALKSLNVDTLERRYQFYLANGLDETDRDKFRSGTDNYSDGVQLPSSFNRLFDGSDIEIGGRSWRVMVGQGHSPEHVSLYCGEAGVLISGDQLLPEISSNVSVWPDEPEADSLNLYLQSLDKFNEDLHPDTLVLPSHKKPFYGAHQRISELKQHHQERLDIISSLVARGAVTAGGLLPHLFRPGLDGFQLRFAMGEALAHLNYLVNKGELCREADSGITWFVRI